MNRPFIEQPLEWWIDGDALVVSRSLGFVVFEAVVLCCLCFWMFPNLQVSIVAAAIGVGCCFAWRSVTKRTIEAKNVAEISIVSDKGRNVTVSMVMHVGEAVSVVRGMQDAVLVAYAASRTADTLGVPLHMSCDVAACITQRGENRVGRCISVCIAAGATLFFFGWSIFVAYLQMDATYWPSTTAKISSLTVDGRVQGRPDVLYSYKVGEKEYWSQSLAPSRVSYLSRAAIEHDLRGIAIGKQVPCWYSPSHPEKAYLINKGITPDMVVFVLIFGYLLVATVCRFWEENRKYLALTAVVRK